MSSREAPAASGPFWQRLATMESHTRDANTIIFPLFLRHSSLTKRGAVVVMADNTQAAHVHFRSSPQSKARLPLSTLDKHCATDFDDFEANKRPNTPLIHSLPIHWE